MRWARFAGRAALRRVLNLATPRIAMPEQLQGSIRARQQVGPSANKGGGQCPTTSRGEAHSPLCVQAPGQLQKASHATRAPQASDALSITGEHSGREVYPSPPPRALRCLRGRGQRTQSCRAFATERRPKAQQSGRLRKNTPHSLAQANTHMHTKADECPEEGAHCQPCAQPHSRTCMPSSPTTNMNCRTRRST